MKRQQSKAVKTKVPRSLGDLPEDFPVVLSGKEMMWSEALKISKEVSNGRILLSTENAAYGKPLTVSIPGYQFYLKQDRSQPMSQQQIERQRLFQIIMEQVEKTTAAEIRAVRRIRPHGRLDKGNPIEANYDFRVPEIPN
jgi:hypothetical protein